MKLFIELLGDSGFVPQSFAAEALSHLLRTSKHIDLRVAIVESLFSMLVGHCDDAWGQIAVSALENIIAIAGSLNERWQISEEDWKEAEATKTPLEIGRSTPIMEMIKTATRDSRINEKWQDETRTRLLLPSIKQSITSNTRWMKIFARENDTSLTKLQVPMLPVDPSILEDAVSDKLGSALFRLFQKYLFTNITPPEQLREFPESLDEKSTKEPPYNHFIHLYGRFLGFKHLKGHPFIYQEKRRTTNPDLKYPSSLTYLQRLAYAILDWKEDDSEAKVQGSIPCKELEEYLFQHAKVLLLEYPYSSAFGDLMKALKRSWGKGEKRWNFLGPGRAFIERIVAYIDSLRTLEWQQDQDRKPEILPSTFQYRLWLLPYPSFHEKLPPHSISQVKEQDGQEEQEISAVANAIKGFVKEVCDSHVPYTEKLPLIQKAAEEMLPCYIADVACILGSLEPRAGRAEMLCLDLAEKLFRVAGVPKSEEAVAESREVVEDWLKSEDEWVRGRGMVLKSSHAFRDKKWRELLLSEDEVK